jgi:hypothetical protein
MTKRKQHLLSRFIHLKILGPIPFCDRHRPTDLSECGLRVVPPINGQVIGLQVSQAILSIRFKPNLRRYKDIADTSYEQE